MPRTMFALLTFFTICGTAIIGVSSFWFVQTAIQMIRHGGCQ